MSRSWLTMSAVVLASGALGIGVVLGQYNNPYGQAPQQQYTPPQQPYPPQYPQQPQYQQQQYQQQQQNNPAVAEAQTELKKLDIQSRLADRVAQIKEDIRKARAAQASNGPTGQLAAWDAEADAAQARAAADMAKIDYQILDLQIRGGLVNPPQQGQQGYGQPPVNNPTVMQVMQLEARKAHIQSSVAGMVRDIRQKQYDNVKNQIDSGAMTSDKLLDASLDLETSKAAADIAAIDENSANTRLQQGGR